MLLEIVEETNRSTANIKEISELSELYNSELNSILLIGESDTSKTLSIPFYILYLIKNRGVPPEQITIMDFGPARFKRDGKAIAGRVTDYLNPFQTVYPELKKVKFISKEEKFFAPRATAKTSQGVIDMCYKNWNKARKQFKTFENNPTEALVINDLSIYLHLGSLSTIKRIKNKAKYFYANAYSGRRLLMDLGSNISSTEMILLKKFMEAVDIVFKTTHNFKVNVVEENKKLLTTTEQN